MSNPYRHPISTPVPELQGIAGIGPKPAPPMCEKHGKPKHLTIGADKVERYFCHHCLEDAGGVR